MVRVLFICLASFGFVAAENGLDGWLRYAPLPDANLYTQLVPSSIVALDTNTTSPVYTAGIELQKGIQGVLGKTVDVSHTGTKNASAIVVGTLDAYTKVYGQPQGVPNLDVDGFWLSTKGNTVQILGHNERGALYGAFEYLSSIAQGKFDPVAYATGPDAPVRMVNQWDNLEEGYGHASIERGYAGPSIYFEKGSVVANLTRTTQYARLLASVRVNGIMINNINANPKLFTPENINGMGRIADAFRPYGVRIGTCLQFGSPKQIGGLNTSDPLDPAVIVFWRNLTDQIYQRIPDFVGYCVKASVEGQPGPLEYNRTFADAANMFGKAVAPYGGIVTYRAFVYSQLNHTDWKADRARAAVDLFEGNDGKFDDNVIIQIKYGPMDFQVREPASPLFSHLKKTNVAIELQVSQEYLGQQNHLVYLPPLWRTILDFDLRIDGQRSTVKDIISGKRFNRKLGGSAAVINVGTNNTWLGSHMAMSNLYAWGRLAWDLNADSQAIVEDWTRLTFGQDRQVVSTISNISMASWQAFENYSGNLGVQSLADVTYAHYGPNPAHMDNNSWGQWIRADGTSIGMDRTVSNGTGFSGQYPPEVAAKFESLATTPQELLLWFHHVSYTYRLHSGKTVIQHFYDAHYDGAATAQTFVTQWESLKGKVDDQRYEEQLFRLKYQAGHSLVWRDAINNYFKNLSGIPDEANRVGNHPWRIEAENMTLSGYDPVSVTYAETASNSMAIVTTAKNVTGTAIATINYPSGVYNVAVNYFDQTVGRAQYELYINNKLVGKWTGNLEDTLGHEKFEYLDGHSATRLTFPAIQIQKGDELKIVGIPDRGELAPVDYVSILPQGIVD